MNDNNDNKEFVEVSEELAVTIDDIVTEVDYKDKIADSEIKDVLVFN